MRAALAQGAVGVVWVTLRETRHIYHWTNVAIQDRQETLAAAVGRRLEQLQRRQALVRR